MAASIFKTDIKYSGMDSSGITITKYYFIKYESGDNESAVLAKGILPEYGSALSENASYVCESIGELELFDEKERIWKVTAKFKLNRGNATGSSDVAPWNLGVQNFRVNFVSQQIPLNYLWDITTKRYKPLTNSAGSRIIDTV